VAKRETRLRIDTVVKIFVADVGRLIAMMVPEGGLEPPTWRL
jgi:hypothetical protein